MSVTYQYYFLSSSSITFSQLYSLWCSVRLRRIWILPLVALRHLCDDTLTALNPRTQSSRWHSSSLLCLPDYSSCHFTFSLRCDCKFVGFQWLSSNLADYSLVEMAWACHCHNLKNGPAATVMYCIIGWEAVRLSAVTSFEVMIPCPLTHRAVISGMNGTKL